MKTMQYINQQKPKRVLKNEQKITTEHQQDTQANFSLLDVTSNKW